MSSKITVKDIVVYKDFSSKEELLETLKETNGHLSLVKESKTTDDFFPCNPIYNRVYELPDIKEVIINEGYETHSFDECLELYKENFENDDRYLPFDNNELYITKDDKYEGCCTVDGYEFTTKDFHYYWTVASKIKD